MVVRVTTHRTNAVFEFLQISFCTLSFWWSKHFIHPDAINAICMDGSINSNGIYRSINTTDIYKIFRASRWMKIFTSCFTIFAGRCIQAEIPHYKAQIPYTYRFMC